MFGKPFLFSLLFFVVFTLYSHKSKCQDPQFTQFYASPLFLNPAFAGLTGEYRAVSNYRNQWTGMSTPFNTYSFSLDKRLREINSGAGFMVYDQIGGIKGFHTLKIAGQFSHKIEVSRKLFLRMGGEIGYIHQRMDLDNFTFGDQFSNNGNLQNRQSKESIEGGYRNNMFDVSFGMLLFKENFWFGSSVHHLNKPAQTFYQNEEASSSSHLPGKFSLMGGFKTYLNKRPYEKPEKDDLNLRPAFLFKLQGAHSQMDIGAYLNKHPFNVGLWYRGIPFISRGGKAQQDAFAILLGLEFFDHWKMGYSFDFPLNKMSNNTGSHEISITYTFKHKYKYKLTNINVVPEI